MTDTNTKCACTELRVSSYSGQDVTYVCACKATMVTRKFTEQETARGKEIEALKVANSIHRLWHQYKKEVLDCYDNNIDLINASEIFAEQHPEVKVSGCDDSYHSNSIVVIVPHIGYMDALRDQYWGTTCVFLSQCAGEPPATYFLYPEALNNHIEDLKAMQAMQQQYGTKLLYKGKLTDQDQKDLDAARFYPKTLKL